MAFARKDLLGIKALSREEIKLILETAVPMKEILQRDIKKVPTLRGRSILTLFYEPSTRTRTSFEAAAKYMSADTFNIATNTSSVTKGESLVDTAWNLEAMGVDAIVIRHSVSGSPHYLAKRLKASVINAGDGTHEHPTQALLDMFTIQEKLGRLDGMEIAIVGDILHSRVARSNILGLVKMGAKVRVVGPSTLIPQQIEELGVTAYTRMEEALEGADAINVLRIQMERQQKGLLPSLREYSRLYCVDSKRVGYAKPGALVLHPGPINRGVEISSEVADGSQSVILEQVTNGVAVRMAILYLIMGGAGSYGFTA